MRACRSCWAILALVSVFVSTNFVQAETIYLPVDDSVENPGRGAYAQDDTGYTDYDSGSRNYLAGRRNETVTLEYRNFFIFDLTSIADREILNAWLEVNVLDIVGGSQTFTLHNVSTDIETLTGDDDETYADTFTDLGNGTSYGSCTISLTAGSTTIQIPLDTSFVNDKDPITGQIALGGALTLEDGEDDQYVFYVSGSASMNYTRLVFTVVPEPSTLLLALMGLAGLLAVRRKG